MTQTLKVKRALISVSDKTGIIEFAQSLNQLGVEILSTGGTYRKLTENNIPAIEISEYTKFPEMMGGRVKTLHPKIHGGILGRRAIDQTVMQEHGIGEIDLVVVNLYPFRETIAKPDCTLQEAIENIDIGGPAMLRSAAKNHADVAVVVNPSDYTTVTNELKEQQGLNHQTRFLLATKAFSHTAQYDLAIANYLTQQTQTASDSEFPETFTPTFSKKQTLRYGENPHQDAAFYIDQSPSDASISTHTQHQGKPLSFNNIADTDTALETVKFFKEPAAVIVKHANPCGVAIGENCLEAYQKAFQTDKTSAFGGIIAFNRELNASTAKAIIDQQFVEVIIAPRVSPEALAVVQTKPNVRVLSCGEWQSPASHNRYDFKRVNGGLLVQSTDIHQLQDSDLTVVTKRQPSPQEVLDLHFAWSVAQFVKSNAIVYVKDGQTTGIGAGQMSRLYSAIIAQIKAKDEGLEVKGSVMASDAFFPFRDGLDAAAEAGVTAVIQPGGSMRDEEVIKAADEANIAMVFTGIRHFRH